MELKGKLYFLYIEDEVVFERYLSIIGKILMIDIDVVCEVIMD